MKADRCDDVFRRAPCALRAGHDGSHVHMEECLPGVAEAADLAARFMGETLEQMRIRLHWPTPNHMRRAADAMDMLTGPARYGDVLRWVADMIDASLPEGGASGMTMPCKRHHWSQVINLRTGQPTGDVGCWDCGKRRVHRHRWRTLDEGKGDTTCVTCHRVRDPQ